MATKTEARRRMTEIRSYMRCVEQCIKNGEMMGAYEYAKEVAACAVDLEEIIGALSEEDDNV